MSLPRAATRALLVINTRGDFALVLISLKQYEYLKEKIASCTVEFTSRLDYVQMVLNFMLQPTTVLLYNDAKPLCVQ